MGEKPSGDLACNPGMCPDWESNWQSFSSQAGTQSIEPHQPGQKKKNTKQKRFYVFLERGKGREKERERSINQLSFQEGPEL